MDRSYASFVAPVGYIGGRTLLLRCRRAWWLWSCASVRLRIRHSTRWRAGRCVWAWPVDPRAVETGPGGFGHRPGYAKYGGPVCGGQPKARADSMAGISLRHRAARSAKDRAEHW